MEVSVPLPTSLAPVTAQLSPQGISPGDGPVYYNKQSHWVGWTNHSPQKSRAHRLLRHLISWPFDQLAKERALQLKEGG